MTRDGNRVTRRTVLGTAAACLPAALGGCVGMSGDSSEPPGVFLALDLADGSKQWEQTYENAVQSGAAVDDETVYIGDDSGYLRALSTADGSERWSFDTISPAYVNPPEGGRNPSFVTTDVAMGAGAVYACTDQATVLAVEADTGEERWRYTLESPYSSPGSFVSTIRATPAVVGDTVAFATGDDSGTIFGVAAGSGNGRWELSMEGSIDSGPATGEDRFYIVDNVGNVRAVATDGETLWEGEVSGLTEGAVTAGGGSIYVGSEGIHALDAETGEQQWVTTERSWVDSGPVIGDESVFTTTRDGTVAAFDRDDGAERWSVEVGAKGDASPALADGLVVSGDRNGRVVALDSSDGSEVWATGTEDRVTATPVVGDGTVYIGTK